MRTVTDVAEERGKVAQLPGWEAPAADATRGRIKAVRGDVPDEPRCGAANLNREQTQSRTMALPAHYASSRRLAGCASLRERPVRW
jgi:hypothetical protein